ncbi:hypothetical protein [Ancylobacter mangrovi]|uniref:Uncharacterized protein n=1 Tax=Ancylobacter mangrovi TaxID=2972472 RepID=A0A9X2PK28_9HYPH|nr:hypothetical protein [Ancylobacter mangrovi]MCS0497520.1 hypothetical protein [Ancylobacter mangrovi]MCS0503831.1 hypothetical protein [Ancylobacter mangrovi]
MAHASFAIAAPSRTTLASTPAKPGFFARFLQRVIEAQTKHVEAEMARYEDRMAAALRGVERNG